MALRFIESSKLPTRWGTFDIHGFEDPFKGKEHIAISMGDCANGEPLLIRIHSECLTGDALGSLRCDCGEQLQEAMKRINSEATWVARLLRTVFSRRLWTLPKQKSGLHARLHCPGTSSGGGVPSPEPFAQQLDGQEKPHDSLDRWQKVSNLGR